MQDALSIASDEGTRLWPGLSYDLRVGANLLSEIEVTYFRSRIDDILREGRPTACQRQFLMDMRQRTERYGTRTRLSEKQMATLKRLSARLRQLVASGTPTVTRVASRRRMRTCLC